MIHHDISKKCQAYGWNPEIALQYDFRPTSPVQFSKAERKAWEKSSPVAKYLEPGISDAKYKYIMLNDLIGHTKLSKQRLQLFKQSIGMD